MRRRLAVAAVAVSVLVSCSGSEERTVVSPEGGTTGCEQAFDEAADAASTPRLQLTLVACDGIGAWVPGAAGHPELVPSEDELRFAASMCATATALDVRESKTCRQALARHRDVR